MLALPVAAAAAAGAMVAVPTRREPTPDHPPYSWMIGEAIAALAEDGGSSAEDAISAFIRDRYPGVPAAHDMFLRYYLAKHVAEGIFVRAAPGRYSLHPDEAGAVAEAPAATSAAARCLETANAEGTAKQPKRGRGRPRKDSSSPKSATGKRPGSVSLSVSPKRRGRPRKDASSAGSATSSKKGGGVPPSAMPERLCRGRGRPPKDVSSPESAAGKEGRHRGSVRGQPRKVYSSPEYATWKEGGNASPAATPKRRGRPRKLALFTATDCSANALVADKNDRRESPSTTDKNQEQPGELALVIVNDGNAVISVAEKDGSKAPPTTPMDHDHDQACILALQTAADVPAPAPVTDKEDGGEAPPTKLAPVANDEGTAPASTAAHKEGIALSTAPEHGTPALLAADAGRALALFAGEKGGRETPSTKNKRCRQPRKAAPANSALGSAPTSIADKKVSVIGIASSDIPKGSPTGGNSALTSAAGEKDGSEVPSAKNKRRRLPRKPAAANAALGLAPTSIADKKFSSKASSDTPKCRRRDRRESEVVVTDKGSAPTSVARKKDGGNAPSALPPKLALVAASAQASASLVPIKPRNLYGMSADELPDDPMFCVLAMPATTKLQKL